MPSLYKPRYDNLEVNPMGLIWKQKSKNENILIIGCGKFGAALAVTMQSRNRSVSVIDLNQDSFKSLPSSFGGIAMVGDGTDIDFLTFAGAKNADILIAATDDDNTNIMVGQMAKQIFKIQHVVVKLYDETKRILYADMDIQTICPASLAICEFEKIVWIADQETI